MAAGMSAQGSGQSAARYGGGLSLPASAAAVIHDVAPIKGSSPSLARPHGIPSRAEQRASVLSPTAHNQLCT